MFDLHQEHEVQYAVVQDNRDNIVCYCHTHSTIFHTKLCLCNKWGQLTCFVT